MKKSKSWLKSLLIVILAMLMVVSLVACNNNKNDDDDSDDPVDNKIVGTETVQDCFNGLWNAAKPIGSTAIPDNADLSIELGMEIALNAVDPSEGTVYQTIDFGVNVQAVVGRTDGSKKNTALKLKLYDPTDADNAEILTIYVFAQDIENIYLDFAGKNVKVPHDMAKLIWNEAFEEKGDLIDLLPEGLENEFIDLKGEKVSINDIVNSFTGDFGSNWSLNSIIDRVIGLLGVNLKEMLEGLVNSGDGIGKTINDLLPMVGINGINDLFDSNGKLDLLKILTGTVGEILFVANKTTNGNVTTHKASLSSTVTGLLGSLKDMIGIDLGAVLGSGTTGEIALQYTETNGVLNDFGILARLGGISIKPGNGVTYYPELSVKINKFKIREANESNKITTKVAKDQYTPEIAFNEKLVLEMHGVDINTIDGMTKEDYSFNGEIEIDVRGMLDIVNVENNKTKANLTVTLKGDDEEPVILAQASFMNGKVVGELKDAFTYKDENDEEKTVKGFVYDLGEDFNVAKLVKESVIASLRKNFPPKEEDPTEDEGSEGSPSADKEEKFDLGDFIKKVSAGVGQALKLVTTNNNIEIYTSNILQTAIDFKEAMYPAVKKADRWTIDNRTEFIVNMLLNPPCKEMDMTQCFEELKAQFDIIMEELKKIEDDKKVEEVPDNNQNQGQPEALNEGETPEEPVVPGVDEEFDWEGTFKKVQDLALRVLYLCAQQVRIKGVATENFKDSDYAKFIKKDANDEKVALTDEDKIFINNIKAVLASQITIKGDLQKGIHASFSVAFADATMSATQSFELIDVTNDTFTDLYAHYEADENKDQWMLLPIVEEEGGQNQGDQEA